ncbi:ATPase [Methanobrevibacter sp. 87.7]|uniref:heavy metal translocating P-type ATPase n=1 Tax=Methanobrevibacter sp. 87.7 TaxID=387957 RepID=UPI000B50F70D|nr:cation-translocating P-type ATPase [Methanobrevibacter sp. 87.7]OWT33611.1 ATPase [Methanobrevibacter sp. 87.7]
MSSHEFNNDSFINNHHHQDNIEHNHDKKLDDCCSDEHDHGSDVCTDDCCSDEHSHDDEVDDCCSDEHDHSGHNHSGGCACCSDEGILSDIGDEEETSKRPYYTIAFGVILLVIAYFIGELNFSYGLLTANTVSIILYVILVLVVGFDTIREGIEGIFNFQVKIELLMTIAVIGAFALNSCAEGALLILLYYISEFLEDLSIDKSKKSISNLVKLSPDTVTILKDGKEEEIEVDKLNIGDIVVVKPGDKIPIDGIIKKGSTSVNQASITGESLAVSKDVGDEVFSSTINEEGYIEVEVSKTADNTVFAKIVELIKDSEEKKAHIDIFVDKFAKYYTPTVVVLAILVACIPTFVFAQPFHTWIYRALCLLVISCPCAVAISTPVSMVSAITAGTNNGIIIKGGEYVEELSNIKAIMFDKTGTLTEGKLKIDNIVPTDGKNRDDILRLACSIEAKSNHPIAKTFNEYANQNRFELYEVEDFKNIPGKGLTGLIDNEKYYVGNKELFNFNEELESDVEGLKPEEGKTLIIIGNSKEILGYITLNDKIRDDTPITLKYLNENNIKTMMITGDNEKTAKLVSDEIGIDKYYANLLPDDKVNIVRDVANEYKDITMVGDGVNDAPSLAMSNVGIAMGMGSDVAIETGDIVLLNDNISKLSYLVGLSKKTMRVVKTNISVAVAVKAILAVVAIFGFIALWEAITLGDVGLTLVVVANALRLANY